MLRDNYISPQWLGLILDSLGKAGLNLNELLEASRLDADAINSPDSLFSNSDMVRLWQAATDLSHNPAIGLIMGSSPNLGAAGSEVVGLLTSENVADAQVQYVKIQDNIGLAPQIKVVEESKGRRIVFYQGKGSSSFNYQSFDAALASFVFGTRFCTGLDVSPSYVSFKQSEPDDRAPYEELFKCPLHFGEDEYSIFYNEDVLELSLILSTNKGVAAGNLDAGVHDKNLISTKIRGYIKRFVSEGEPSVKEVASHFCLGPRTLQRKLRDEGFTYNQIVDSVRKEMVDKLMEEPSISFKQIIHEVGFSDHSSFNRAFKRWYNCSPSDYKKNHQ